MKNIFRLISLISIIKIILTFDCLENEIDNCECIENSHANVTYICKDLTDTRDKRDPKQFQILIEPLEVTLKCVNLAKLENFHYDFRSIIKDLTTLVLDNCDINKNTDIDKINELTSTSYVGRLVLHNTLQYNILIENPIRKLDILVGLSITDVKNLKTLTQRPLQNAINIYYLTIKRCNMDGIEKDAFHHVMRLLKMDLSENKLIYIQPTTFDNLSELTDLDLSGNQMEILDDDLFEKLTVLKNLNIGDNKLTTISENLINKLYHLEVFSAAGNFIATIHKNAFKALSRLVSINLSKNKIIHLSSENNKANIGPFSVWSNYSIFSQCTNLRDLDLSFNSIDKFYIDWIQLLENRLTHLYLAHNLIRAFTLYNLTVNTHVYIDVTNNQLRGINLNSLGFWKFNAQSRLQIDARNNPFVCDCFNDKLLQFIRGSFPNNILNKHLVINVEHLKCHEPQEHKGKYFSTLTHNDLACTVNSNNLNEEKGTCKTKYFLSQLQTVINCFNAGLNKIPEDLGIIISFATDMNLTNNEFQYIPTFSSSEAKAIRQLTLSGNKIKNLDNINLLENIEVLELNNNEIEEITEEDLYNLKSLKKLKRIAFNDNPLACGPNFESLKKLSIVEDRNILTCIKKTIVNEANAAYSQLSIASLCMLPRDEVEKIWENTCSIHF